MDAWERRQQLVEQVNEPTKTLVDQADRLLSHEERVERFWRRFTCRCGHRAGGHVSYGYGLDRRLGACCVPGCGCVEFEDVK